MFGPPSTELPKPASPYTPDWRFQAQSHTPPAPTPVVRECCISSKDERRERAQLSPVERCLKRPPLPCNEGDDTISLEAGDGHNSQVLTVEVPALVAKIYDPLYFDDDDGYLDPFRCMDMYYTHEANAYPALHELQGLGIPTYFGSYTVNLPVDEDRSRGPLGSRIYEKNLWLTDLEPRNQQPRVVFVDLAHALFNRRRDDPLAVTLNRFLGEYISPLLRWKNPQAQGGPPLRTGWTGIGDPWLTAEFAHTVTNFTLEVRERWADI
ncbi:uncharacterized protein BO95DRAFT_450806 [Aspergillus brunneoviolaceus CBS 621.78]|uniref:Uncharacterized protein n=1 Tax=Aspergillus brunneoviolaceus CBS 621.78 TaxID=1450534 RepID=A0ACD1GIA9_9EURO|nr:hypothetical protein BO95DRAFT_450806 [Aspergillus brunneoviolaceus CBS 621.78]RAH48922.1 hypothetical protein BO95DRAFT_450806 [Aspergillus brunneoviolaceus CBS 621.78]